MINPRVSSLHKSATLKITALTKKLLKEGKDIVNFAAGEPDFDTPLFVKDAAKEAIDRGFTKYTPSTGTKELKEAIAKKLNEENNLPVGSENIIVTAGAKYAIFLAVFTLLREGEEVILPSPYWVSYPEIVTLAGGKTRILKTSLEDNFRITPAAFAEAITSRSKILILNYPNNPTGVTYSREELSEISLLARKKNIFVLSDEIYESLTYTGKEHSSFASLPGAADFTLTVNGFSKIFSMTGWRLGYLAAKEPVIREAAKIVDHTTSCPVSISQNAALAALADRTWKKKIRAEFEERRNIFWEGLRNNPKLKPIKPEGAFYLFCDVRKTGLTSYEFASQLLEKQLVSSIPADSFGAEGFVRFSFATSIEQIRKGIGRINDFLSGA